MAYAALIAAAVPNANARHVEGYMRAEAGGTLDHLGNVDFVRLARKCARETAIDDPALAEEVARSYGL